MLARSKINVLGAATISCLLAGVAAAQSVVVANAPGSAPACHSKDDLLELVSAINARNGRLIMQLTKANRCWGVWDGSSGEIVDLDQDAGLAQVSFTHLERLPEGRRETLWLDRSVLETR